MNTLKCAATAVTVLLGISLGWSPLRAEPLMTIFQFSEPNYADTVTTNAIVVTITRTDQDPDATDTQNFTVDCKFTGGTAIENEDFRFSFKWPASGVWKVAFPPGVKENSFTIYTIKHPGPNKTLHFQLTDPDGPRPAVTGNNPSTTVTVVNPPPPPPAKKT
jgi:hypothetical protein